MQRHTSGDVTGAPHPGRCGAVCSVKLALSSPTAAMWPWLVQSSERSPRRAARAQSSGPVQERYDGLNDRRLLSRGGEVAESCGSCGEQDRAGRDAGGRGERCPGRDDDYRNSERGDELDDGRDRDLSLDALALRAGWSRRSPNSDPDAVDDDGDDREGGADSHDDPERSVDGEAAA